MSWISESASGEAGLLVAGLVDDAGLFPPESLSMVEAVARHHDDGRSGSPVLTHRFVCPLTRFDELTAQLSDGVTMDVVALAPLTEEAIAELVARAAHPSIRVVGLETVLPDVPFEVNRRRVGVLDDMVPDAELYLEVRLGTGLERDLDVAARLEKAVKVRCGGMSPEHFPSAADVALFLVTVANRGTPFKATAGLHHAVSYENPATGFSHFGFLNFLVAMADAQAGGLPAEIEVVLRGRAPGPLLARVGSLGRDEMVRLRAQFRSFGCCSTSEPLQDLLQLGLLDHSPLT